LRDKKVVEGYLYSLPYGGDLWILADRELKPEELSFRAGKRIDDVLEEFQGRKVRVTIELVEQ